MYTDLIYVHFVYMYFVKQGNCLPSTENKPVDFMWMLGFKLKCSHLCGKCFTG